MKNQYVIVVSGDGSNQYQAGSNIRKAAKLLRDVFDSDCTEGMTAVLYRVYQGGMQERIHGYVSSSEFGDRKVL